MAIQILPPQLANQIAAGEVVERPASVVKELVENSLDAGATRIDIEINKGGSKLIRIKDNGGGIQKSELSLALSRHATSKVHSLDDLEGIMSFGFRGEALASISSVSRLSLTSKISGESEAWQAQAEGSDMAVKVIPSAHPVGTTIEVVDLFFNTPARRRFLKSDKTEFTHIDDWLKRIALVQGEIHFTLSHNGKIVRNYRAAKTEAQYLQRLTQVCGRSFAENAVSVACKHDGMAINGYLQSPDENASFTDVHYFYVNGRLVRDRLVNHAVRQAFAQTSASEQPGYVLMFEIDPHQVDVNVHPAKHEVRFHQSRYVHDYILQALQSALSQIPELVLAHDDEYADSNVISKYSNGGIDIGSQTIDDDSAISSGSSVNAIVVEPSLVTENQSAINYQSTIKNTDYRDKQSIDSMARNKFASASDGNTKGSYASTDRSIKLDNGFAKKVIDRSAVETYQRLMQTPIVLNEKLQPLKIDGAILDNNRLTAPPLLDKRFWVMTKGIELTLLPVILVANILAKYDIISRLENGLVSQPLLMPVSISAANENWHHIIDDRSRLLRKLGIELIIRHEQLIIKKVPPYLRESRLATVIPEFLQWIEHEEPIDQSLASWMSSHIQNQSQSPDRVWSLFKSQTDEIQQEIYASGIKLPWQLWEKEHFSEG